PTKEIQKRSSIPFVANQSHSVEIPSIVCRSHSFSPKCTLMIHAVHAVYVAHPGRSGAQSTMSQQLIRLHGQVPWPSVHRIQFAEDRGAASCTTTLCSMRSPGPLRPEAKSTC